jgi:arylsulfatase A-like enzyme
MQWLQAHGKLSAPQRACFVHPRPVEELYDLDADPDELHNLAVDPAHAEVLRRMRDALEGWARETGDQAPATRSPDEFDRETGDPLPGRVRPRPAKKRAGST